MSQFLKKAHFRAINLVVEGVKMGVKALKMSQYEHIGSIAFSKGF